MRRNSILWIVAGAIAAMVLLIANVLLNFSNVRELNQDAYWVDHTYSVIGGLDGVLSLVKDAETGQRGFIVTGEPRYLEPYNAAVNAIDAKVGEIERLTTDSSEQQGRLPELRRRIALRLEILGGNLRLRQTDGFEAARAGIMTGRGENAMVGVRSLIAEMVDYEQKRLRERTARHEQTYRTTVLTGLLSGLLSLIAIAAFLLMLRRYLRSRSRAATIIADQSERLRITLASIGDAVISTDREGRVNYLNAVAESLTGWSNSAAAGEPLETVFNIINETTRETVENPAVKALREGVIVGLANHTILISKNGAEWPIDDSAAPIRDEQGAISGVVLIFREISERKLAENELRRAHEDLEIKVAERTAELANSNQFLNALLDNLQEGIVACDADGVLTTFNRATREFHGLPEEPMPAEQWAEHYDLFHPDGATRMSKDEIPLFRALAGEEVKAAEMVIAPKNGELRTLLASGQQFRNDDGKVLGAVVSMHDITRRKRAEEALQAANDNLEIRVAERTAELAASEERATNIVSSIADGLITLDHEWRITYINPRGEEILRPLQMTDSGVRGKNFWEEFPATIGTISEENYRRAVREQVMVQFENFYAPLECWFDIRAYPSRDGVSLYFLDITARKQAEADQAERNRLISLRADISAALASDRSLLSVLQGAAESIVQSLDMAFARIWTHDEQKDVLELQASAGLYTHVDGPHSRVKVGEFKIGKIAESRKAHLTNAVADDPNVSDPEWAESEGMAAFAGYPLLVENKIVGVLAMFSRNPLSANVLTELAPLADAIAQFIHRKKTEENLTASESRFRVAVGAVSSLIWTNNAQGEMVSAQPGWSGFTGQTLEEYSGYGWANAVHPDDRQPTIEAWNSAVAEKRTFVFEHRVRRMDGEWRLFSVRAVPVLNGGGEIREWVGVHTDITEQRQADEKLRESEVRFRTMADNAPVMVWVTEPDGYCSYLSASWYDFTGQTPETGMGMGWVDAVHPDERAMTNDAFVSANEIAGKFRVEYRLLGKDGEYRWFIDAASPRIGPDGQFLGYIGSVVDINDRKAIEQMLGESEKRFRELAETMPQIVWTAGTNGVLNYYNRRWFEYIDVHPDSTEDAQWDKHIHPDDMQTAYDAWAKSIGSGLPYEIEFRVKRSDGMYRWFLVRALPVRNDEGQINQWFGTCTDIHEQKEMANELRKLAANLSEADHRKNEFLAMLAHELRNPLAPISNALQIIRLTDDGGSTAATEMMERQVGQLVRLVDDLLDVSRITQGKIELRRERIELASVVHHTVEAAKPSCEKGGVDLRVTLESQPIYVDGDQTRLAQVIGNLLNNSCKFTDKDGSIDLIVRREDSNAVIRVIDTGIGIAPGQISHIFELFVQADTSLERSISGLGIGLTLVKNLVEMHGGTIKAKSEGLGHGSEFTVYLPVLEDAVKTSLDPDMTINDQAGEGRKILVVDDNMDSAESLSMLLQMKGNEVRMAHDGREAVDTAADFLPQVVLLDIGLPVLNGYEAAREIRRQPWGENMILIALTGWGQDEDRQRSKDAGFDSHMVKPVDHMALMKRLDELTVPESEPPA